MVVCKHHTLINKIGLSSCVHRFRSCVKTHASTTPARNICMGFPDLISFRRVLQIPGVGVSLQISYFFSYFALSPGVFWQIPPRVNHISAGRKIAFFVSKATPAFLNFLR